ncbi:MAG: MFS transporter, partial [Ilumatobacteraceae bacterium]
AVALIVATTGVVAVATAGSLVVMLAAFVAIGLAIGVYDVAGNTLVVWSRPGRSGPVLNGLHLCYAIGALASPLLVDGSLASFHALWPLAVPLGVGAAWCVRQLLTRQEPVRTRSASPRPGGVHRGPIGGRRLPLASICLFLLICVAVEAGFAGWIHTYVEQIHYGGAGTALGVTAMLWVGFVVGRVAAIWMSRHAAAGRILAGSVVAMLVAGGLLWLLRGPGLWLWVATFLFGLAIAPQFAATIAFAEAHLALSARSTSAFIASAGIGSLTMPWAIGQLFDAHGPQALPPVIAVGSVLVALAAALVGLSVVGRAPTAKARRAVLNCRAELAC